MFSSEYRWLKRSRIFIRIIIFQIFGILVIIIENFFNIYNITEYTFLKKALVMYIPLGGPIILLFYTDLILTILKEKTIISKTTGIAGSIAKAFCIINIISTIIFMYIAMHPMSNPSFELVYSEFFSWFNFFYILSLACMVIGSSLLIVYKKYLGKREFLTLLSYSVFPTLAVILELYLSRLALINFSITLAIFIYYSSIHSELIQQIKKKEVELTENKVSIMLSQIQPHFMYNVLSAIVQLCDENPAKAKKMTLDFSTYLRNNMESLNYKGLISVEKEINHVKGYLDLEKTMYGNALKVIFYIQAGNFKLPPLTLQPIVENAVKHGIGKKEGGGTITISVRETDNEFLIFVSDDGAGYNSNNPYQDTQKHIGIGITNVKQRLKEQCGGTLEISGAPALGTNAEIRIPKERHHENRS